MYSNKEYSLEQFRKDYAEAKEVDGNNLRSFVLFRMENGEKVPIMSYIKYDDVVRDAKWDYEKSGHRFDTHTIEGVGFEAAMVVTKFTSVFEKELFSQYTNTYEGTLTMDDNAKRLKRMNENDEITQTFEVLSNFFGDYE